MRVSLFRLSLQGILLNYLLSPYNWFCRICASHHLVPELYSGMNAHDMVFNACFWFGFIDTHALDPARHLPFITSLVGEFWLSWICMFRSWNLELVKSLGCWSEMRSESMNHQLTVQSHFLLGLPARLSSFFFCNSCASFMPFIIVYLFVFSYLRLSVM